MGPSREASHTFALFTQTVTAAQTEQSETTCWIISSGFRGSGGPAVVMG